jgi:hypothetical protein
MFDAKRKMLLASTAAIVALSGHTFAFDADTYSVLLSQYAPAGNVDYAELKAKDFPRLERVYQSLATLDPKRFQSADEELAFWMNAYNAIVLYSATRSFPETQIGSEGGDFFKRKHPIAGQKLSLDEIEREKIRKNNRDARVHFGVNCGSRSCPLLAAQPYTAENIRRKLDLNASLFINDDANVKFDADKGLIQVSEIFKWYADDFALDSGSVEKFLEKYLAPEKKTILASRRWKLVYIPYDWSLNAAKLR